MTTHLALLRGINVSGHNIIKMEALKTTLEAIGFQNVQTYIQSGNVFVDTDEHVNRVLPKLKEMAAHRLIVRENVVLEQGNLD